MNATRFDNLPKDILGELLKYIDVRTHCELPFRRRQHVFSEGLGVYAAEIGSIDLLRYAIRVYGCIVKSVPPRALHHQHIVDYLLFHGAENCNPLYMYAGGSAEYLLRVCTYADFNVNFTEVVKRNDLTLLKKLNDTAVDPDGKKVFDNPSRRYSALWTAISRGFIDVVKWLDPTGNVLQDEYGTCTVECAEWVLSKEKRISFSHVLSPCSKYGDVIDVLNYLEEKKLLPANPKLRCYGLPGEVVKWLLERYPKRTIRAIVIENRTSLLPICEMSMYYGVKFMSVVVTEYLLERGVPINLNQKIATDDDNDIRGEGFVSMLIRRGIHVPTFLAARYPSVFPNRAQEILDYHTCNGINFIDQVLLDNGATKCSDSSFYLY